MVKKIPVIEEELTIGKRIVKKGSIIIQKNINTEDISVDIPLNTEIFDIERVNINQYLDSSPVMRHEGDTLIIPVTKEVLIKKLLLVEEIRIRKKTQTINKTEKVTLRKEEIKITRKEK